MSSRLGHLLKCVTVSLFLLFYFSPDASAAQVQLAWDQSTDPAVIGYRIHYGTQRGNLSSVVDAGANLSVTVDGLSAAQTYYFAATSYSTSNESTFSPELVCDFITVIPSSNGQITPGGTIALPGGGSEQFSIAPDTGYKVSYVLVDGKSFGASSSYTFSNVSGGHSIEAVFTSLSYTVTASAGTGGSISPTGAHTVSYGASQTFTIAAYSGYYISAVVVDGTPQAASPSYTFKSVTANHTISATFTQTTYTISASAGTGGSISPAGSQAVPFGTNQSFTIAPAANYKISSLHVDGKPIPASSTYTFSYVAANHRIAAHFEPLEYFISSASNSGGSISPSGTTKVRAGRNVTYTITSAKHHKLSDVLIDGKSFSLVSCGTLTREVSGATSGDAYTYSFTDVSADHTIQAVFLNIPPPVADPGPDQDVESGSIVKLDGVNSTDFLSGIASYKWTQTAGPPVNLSCPLAGPECTFNAPGTSHGACLVFKLQVTNKAGLTSSALCLVNVSTVDKAPLANAGASRSVHPYDIVNLDGSRSSDPEGRIASYTWTQVHGPAVEIHNADTHTATFVAPDPGPAGVSLVFTLWVKDNFGLTTRDWVTINVVRDDEPPVANAGPNQTAAATAAVTLYGSRSLDPEVHWTDIYRWKQISGVPVKLSDPTAVNPTFFAPADTTGAQSDNLVFRLTVTDAQDGLRSISKCSVTVQNR